MKEILVTGGWGFLGRHLLALLSAEGHALRVLDVAEPPGETGDARGAAEVTEQVTHVPGSVTDADAVRRAVEGADAVFHLAALSDLWAPDREDFRRVNLHGTLHVLSEADRAGVDRVVHTSSEVALGGRLRPEETVDQRPEAPAPSGVVGAYARSKFQAERAAHAAAARGLPVMVVSPTVPVGPGDHGLTPPSRMLVDLLNGDLPAYLEATLGLVDVRDVARAHLRALEVGEPGERYLALARTVKMSALVRILEELTGLSMTRRRIPYPIALAAAAVMELVADHVTGSRPAATVAGVRQARRPVSTTGSLGLEDLGIAARPIRESLTDAVRWFHRRGLLTREPRVVAGSGGRNGSGAEPASR